MDGSTTLEKWVSLLTEFGPCAFFVFMFFVGLSIARRKAENAEQQKVQNIAYSVVWLSIFVFAGLATVVYWKVNFPSEQCIHGYIRGLEDPATVSTRDNIFLKKVYGADKDYDLEFRIINPDKDAKFVGLELQASPDGLHAVTYRIPLERCDRNGKIPVEYTYERASGKLRMEVAGKEQTLNPQVEDAMAEEPVVDQEVWWKLPVMHAAMVTDTNALVRALDANDPVARGNARQQLIANGPGSVQVLQASLPVGSLRQRFETLRTLNGMRGVDGSVFSQPARCAVVQMASNSDPAVRGEATRLLSGVGRGWRC